MLTLEQVKLLDSKVESLIEMVKSLCAERDALNENLKKKDQYIDELERKVSTYEAEQVKIEECVGNTLDQLSLIHNFACHSSSSPTLQTTAYKENEEHALGEVNSDESVAKNDGVAQDELEANNPQEKLSQSEKESEDVDKQMAIF